MNSDLCTVGLCYDIQHLIVSKKIMLGKTIKLRRL